MVRIVFDEAHKILTDQAYRTNFLQLHQLAAFPVCKIYLTATLPPILTASFLDNTGLPDTTKIIRAPTTRANLQYLVIKQTPRKRSLTDVAVDLVDYFKSHGMDRESRGIIFSTTIQETDELSRALHCVKSHSKMSAEERFHHHNTWNAGEQKWIVATSGFIHGIDYPHVRVVIFLNIPFGAVNIEQGGGRCARDGLPGVVLLVTNAHAHVYCGPKGVKDDEDFEAFAAGYKFTHDPTCRRYTMTSTMDGHGVTCLELPEAQLCDICGPSSPLLASACAIVEKELIPSVNPSPESGLPSGSGQPMVTIIAYLSP